MKKLHTTVSTAGALLLIGCIAVQPFGTMKSLENAFANKDEAEVRDLVDFPRLKENIRYQLHASIEQEAKKAGASREVGEIISVLGGALLDQVVTPNQLIEFASKQRASKEADPSYRYESLSKFTATFPTAKGVPLTLVLERQGFSWRLTDIGGILDNYVPFPDDEADRSSATDADVSAAEGETSAPEPSESPVDSSPSWQEVCRRDLGGVGVIARKMENLSEDELTDVCRCVEKRVPDSVTAMRSTTNGEEVGSEHEQEAMNSFDSCYLTIAEDKVLGALVEKPYAEARVELIERGFVPVEQQGSDSTPGDLMQAGFTEIETCANSCLAMYLAPSGSCVQVRFLKSSDYGYPFAESQRIACKG